MAGTIKLEKLGKPGVFFACDTFAKAARSASHDKNMPTVRFCTVSSADFYRLRGSVEEVRPLVENVFEEFISALITPLTREETDPEGMQEGTGRVDTGPAEMCFSADDYTVAAELFNQSFLDNKWGDGLPLVPPTPERVQWMLTGTQRSPGELIGRVSPKQGDATVEKIAINAVMAGAKPEYLPVIIAAMEAITDKDYDDRHFLLSAGSFSLLIVVSGPIAKEIGMRTELGFLGHGWRANNTIGRAVRLTTLNIGHIWPGENDMGITGRISAHTFFTFAENENSAWEPYHVSRGFKAGDSCVTVASIAGTGPIQNSFGGGIGTWNARQILENIVASILNSERRALMHLGKKGVGLYPGSGEGSNNHFIVLFPKLVDELQSMGFGRQELKEEIYRRARVNFEELTQEEIASIRRGMEIGSIPPERRNVFAEALRPGGKVPVLISPENIHLFCAGGAPGYAFSFRYMRVPPYNKLAVMTKKITG
ncbi:MAG TPA: hypothetical protein GX699_11140 [Firmicutes bacterium]|nr:hypothetical protein [Bacillota bacterium]